MPRGGISFVNQQVRECQLSTLQTDVQEGSSTPSMPDPVPLPPPPPAPEPPKQIKPDPEPLKIEEPTEVKQTKSKREEEGQVSKGTSQLRIPLNTGSGKSGGLNF